MKGNLVIEGKVLEDDGYGGKHYNKIFDEWWESDDIDSLIDTIVRNGYLKFYRLGVPCYLMLSNMSCIYFNEIK